MEFDTDTSNSLLIEAINYYKNKDGNLTSPPLNLLEQDQQYRVYDTQGKFRVSLYKVLLFEKMASGIKSGALNLRYSYKYRAFDDYLIPKNIWENQHDELLEKGGLLNFKIFGDLAVELKKTTQKQFQKTAWFNFHHSRVTL